MCLRQQLLKSLLAFNLFPEERVVFVSRCRFILPLSRWLNKEAITVSHSSQKEPQGILKKSAHLKNSPKNIYTVLFLYFESLPWMLLHQQDNRAHTQKKKYETAPSLSSQPAAN